MRKRTGGRRRQFLFNPEFDAILDAQCAASGTTTTEAVRRAVLLRERVRTAGTPSVLHPQGERLCFQDIATGKLRPIDWL